MSSLKPDLFGGVQYGRTPRKFTHEVSFRFEDLRSQPGCYQLTSVRVLITTREPYSVQLAKELRAGTCTYKVVHHHEFLHARVTTAAIDRMVADARTEAAKGVVLPIKKFKSRAAAEKAFNAQINKLVRNAIKKHVPLTVKNHKRIDSKNAKTLEQRACSDAQWAKLAKKAGK